MRKYWKYWDSDQLIKRILNDSLEQAKWKKNDRLTLPLEEDFKQNLLKVSTGIENSDLSDWVSEGLKKSMKTTIQTDWCGSKGDNFLAVEIKSRLFALDRVNHVKNRGNNFVKYHFADPITAWGALYNINSKKLGVPNHEKFDEALELLKYYSALNRYADHAEGKKIVAVLFPFFAHEKKIETLKQSIEGIKGYLDDLGKPFFTTVFWKFSTDPCVSKGQNFPDSIVFDKVYQSGKGAKIPVLEDVNVKGVLKQVDYKDPVKGCNECSHFKHCSKFT